MMSVASSVLCLSTMSYVVCKAESRSNQKALQDQPQKADEARAD